MYLLILQFNMKRNEFIIQTKIQNPHLNLENIEKIADELVDKKYLTKEVKTRTNKISTKTWYTPKEDAEDFFKNWINSRVWIECINKWISKDDLKDFWLYRNEKNKSWTKSKWELQPTFETMTRIIVWIWKNKKSWIRWNIKKWKSIW